MPTNYMIFHGLIHYGFKHVARDLADRTFHMVLDENAVTREYYNAETGGGNGQTQFWGFSALGYVMPLELELGYDPTDLNQRSRQDAQAESSLHHQSSEPGRWPSRWRSLFVRSISETRERRTTRRPTSCSRLL